MTQDGYPKMMVAVSTQQNSTNLLPFIQLDCKAMLLLETDYANRKRWKEGICEVIESRGKTVTVLPLGEGDELSDIIEKLLASLAEIRGVVFNIGGGQKMQQIGMQHVFQQRVQKGRQDVACYTIPQNKKTYIIRYQSNKALESIWQPTDVFLDLQETTAIFGHKPFGRNMQLLWDRKSGISKVADFISENDASWLRDYEKRQEMFAYTLAVDKKQQVDEPPFPSPFDEYDPDKIFGIYFETVVQYEISRVLTDDPDAHCVNQIWANVRLRNDQFRVESAEYDILLVTNFGTFLPIDAKTYDFKRKDEQARIYNLEQASGLYTEFWSVFPCFTEDIKDESILQRKQAWHKLLNMPFEMQRRGSKMLVMSGRGVKNLCLKKGKRNKVTHLNEEKCTDNKKVLKVNTLEQIIQALNLGRIEKEQQ